MKKFYFFIFLMLIAYSCKSDLSANSVKLNPVAFKDSIDNIGVQIVDVRTFKEFHESHINNALSINFLSEKFSDSIGLLDNKKPVFIYCRSGKRSAKSVSEFKALGFKKVYELEGGILNWSKEDFKTVSN